MPTYDYQCDACGHEFELFQQMSDSPKRKCPKCGKAKLQRLIGTGAGIIFKGGGFYETDYRSDNYKKSAEADKKAAEPKPEPKADSKSDTKSENKNESKTESKSDAKPESKSESKPERVASKSAARRSNAKAAAPKRGLARKSGRSK
jgi:putative FmdB family regulatory protein